MRLSTFPTLHGEKAVVRLFAGAGRFLRLADLGLPAEVHDALSQVLDETSGAGILSGPAGSGKTTSLYACLRELAARRIPVSRLTDLSELSSLVKDGLLPPGYVGGFSSRYPGGANFLFGDSSVRLLSQKIRTSVYRSLGNRADGNLISGDEY